MIANVKSSKDNIKAIQSQFDEVIGFSQGFTPNSDALFETWFEAKRDIIEAWGGQLIIELPSKVAFELSQKEKDTRLDEFINAVSITFDNEALASFLEDNRQGFFKNRVVADGEARMNGEVHKIPLDMKLLKAFKYFEDDEQVVNELQTMASMIIQEDKVEGRLCFSVHPLDFLSSSENTYNWRSCHALDGEYRAGNLSYMVDSSTIMCYLRGGENERLPNFPPSVRWNSKKWRMLLFLSEKWDVMFAGRQYPFFSRTALDIVKDYMTYGYNAMLNSGSWSGWHDDELRNFEYKDDKTAFEMDGGNLMWPYICISNELFPIGNVVKDAPHSMHFNDLLRSSYYKPYYCFRRYRQVGQTPVVSIGGAIPCLSCGQHHVATTDSMLCEECELEFGNSEDDRYGYCDLCERRIIIDDAHLVDSHGHLICDWCYEHHTTSCESCGDLVYNDDIVYDKISHSYLCQGCYSNRHSCHRDNEWQTVSATNGVGRYYTFSSEPIFSSTDAIVRIVNPGGEDNG